ncbi:MAG: tRNA (guanosine(46)-N7)-methyltransferase TrmB [Erysipelotrichaceae bacterium]|nr:tRNA (guanosine(46)-N7)-methyltransferase TrmB [Erysipelotrichaceae bacterium]MDY5252284.1 tRNA (guanosine(46)-N7)-methyltransferase TrmB [Erysipelotrichaceae bacterium]
MRMRKKKWAMPFLQEHPEFVIFEPEINKGRWKEVFKKDKLHIEIGCGKGDYFIQMSKMYQDEAWLAIEKDYNCAAVAAKKALEDINDNALLVTKDAQDIANWFADKEVDVIHLNFSDPWPKSKNSKRRLSHSNFLQQYHKILSDEGQIILKTDNQKFFEFSLVEFTHANFELVQVWVDFRRDVHDEDAISEYEAKFMGLGQPIYRAIFAKVVL